MHVAPTHRFVLLRAILVLGIAFLGSAVAAKPFLYVVTIFPHAIEAISVVDTATDKVVGRPITIGLRPIGGLAIAVSPNGKYLYATFTGSFTVWVIDTATNTIVAEERMPGATGGIAISPNGKVTYVVSGDAVVMIDTATHKVVGKPITVAISPGSITVAPDGKTAYVASASYRDTGTSGSVTVIDTTTNEVVGDAIQVGHFPQGIAVTPDGRYVYVACESNDGRFWVIDTVTNTVVTTIPLGVFWGHVIYPIPFAITPDGMYIYVANRAGLAVISTATNSVVARIPVTTSFGGIVFTPDGGHAYLTNIRDRNVSIIDTATNTFVNPPIAMPGAPRGIAIMPPPPSSFFPAFSAKLGVSSFGTPEKAEISLRTDFTVKGTTSLDPAEEPVTVQAGTFVTTIPAGSFTKLPEGPYVFDGAIDGVSLHARLAATGTRRYAFSLVAKDADVTGTRNPAPVALQIGNDRGGASVRVGARP